MHVKTQIPYLVTTDKIPQSGYLGIKTDF